MPAIRCLLVALSIIAAIAVTSAAQMVDRGPYLQTMTPTSVIVRWRTDVPTDSTVRYGSAVGALTNTVSDPASVLDHIVAINGLQPDTKYFYSVGTSTMALDGDSSGFFFRTAPVVGTRKPTRVWVLGDSGRNNAIAHRVRDAYAAYTGPRETDLFLMLGDNAYTTGTDAEYQVGLFQNQFEEMLRKAPLWPAMGNHDEITASSSAQMFGYYDIFSLPTNGEAGGVPSGHESYFSFDYANIHFICLNSALTNQTLYQNMFNWLLADLAANTAEWTIAYWHHPPYSKGTHDSDVELDLVVTRAFLVAALEALGVDLVLCGHSHGYERSKFLDGHYGDSTTFNPAVHVVDPSDGSTAGGGAYRKPGNVPIPHAGASYVVAGSSSTAGSGTYDHPAMLKSMPKEGSVVLDVDGDQLDIAFLDLDGIIRDEFTLVRNGVTPLRHRFQPLPPMSTWRYDDTGMDLGTAWLQPGFDDSAWLQGTGVLGFGENYIATNLVSGSVTYYFRTSFDAPADPAVIERLRLAIAYDDGAVVYLNGTEIARFSLPAGTILNTTTGSSHEGDNYETIDITSFKSLLLPTGNILAVEVHQCSATSSDLVMDATVSFETNVPFLGSCASGAQSVETLRINGSTGGSARSVDVEIGSNITIDVDEPATNPGAPFILLGRIGTPITPEAVDLGAIGTLCFAPQPLDPMNPALFVVVNSYGSLGIELLPPTTTPFTITAPGLPFPFDFTFQAVVSVTPTDLRTTNAVRLAVVP